MTEEREPVQVGIDLRPIPLRLTDGSVFSFNPDPDKQFFATVSRLKADRQKDDDWEFIDTLRDVLASQIVDEKQRAEFLKNNYGLAVLNDVAHTYSEEALDRPTRPSN